MKPLDILLILVSLLFATGLIVDKTWGPARREHEKSVQFQQRHLEKVVELIEDHHKKVGRYPTMEEGLASIPGLREATYGGSFKQLAPQLESLPYVRTPHGIPYVYENRLAAEAEEKGAFRNSPTRLDRKVGRYSQRVADGVFVSSLGLMHDVRRVFSEAWIDALIWFGGGLMVTLTVAYILARNRSRTADRFRGVNATIIVGVSIVLALVFLLTGGHHKLGQRGRPKFEAVGTRADLAAEYLALHAEWVDAGALDREAFERVGKQLAGEFGIAIPNLAPPAPPTPPVGPETAPDGERKPH